METDMHQFTQKLPLLNSVPVAAERLGICRAMIYKLIDQEKIATVKIGSRRLVAESELERIAKEGA